MITTVPYVYEAFSQVYAIDQNPRWLRIMQSIADHVFEGYRDSDDSTEVKWRNHTIVTFRFTPVDDVFLSGFNQQNAIQDLTFQSERPKKKS